MLGCGLLLLLLLLLDGCWFWRCLLWGWLSGRDGAITTISATIIKSEHASQQGSGLLTRAHSLGGPSIARRCQLPDEHRKCEVGMVPAKPLLKIALDVSARVLHCLQTNQPLHQIALLVSAHHGGDVECLNQAARAATICSRAGPVHVFQWSKNMYEPKFSQP